MGKGKMKKKILIGSILAVVIIVFASFTSVVGKVSTDDETDDEFVEFDVEFVGLGKKHTVQLTQQEADEVDLLFDDIEQRLSEVETREEAELIFKDAVVELDKYGLLGGLNIRQAQRLIVGNKIRQKLIDIGETKNNNLIDNTNLLCYIYGDLSNSHSFGLIRYCFDIFDINYINDIPFQYLGIFLLLWFNYIAPIVFKIKPINILSVVTVGETWSSLYHSDRFRPSEGTITSIGIMGNKKWDGDNLRGCISDTRIGIYLGGPEGEVSHFHPGMIGFMGLKYVTREYPYDRSHYLGFALKVSIENYEEVI